MMKPWFEASARTKLLHTCGVIVSFGLWGCSGSEPSTQPNGGPTASSGPTAGSDATSSVGTTGDNPASVGGGVSMVTVATAVGGSTATDGAPTPTGSTTSGSMISGPATTGGPAATGGATTGDSGTGGAAATGSTTATTGSAGAGGSTTAATTTGGATTGGPDPCTQTTPLSGGTQRCSNGLGDLGNGGYSWEVWMDSGSNCATYYGVDAAFRSEWNLGESGDFLARAGLFFGSTQTHEQIGTISADYSFTKGNSNGFSWVAVYGWTFDPAEDYHNAEYYIVEDWSVFRPAVTYEQRGTITVDGGTYDIFYNRRIDAPSPSGNRDFDQFWSVRQEPRQCGHISISEHFNAWSDQDMDMGKLMREAMIVTESLEGSGTIDFTYATVQVD